MDMEATKLIEMRVLTVQARTELCEDLVGLYGVLIRIYESYASSDPNEDPFGLTWESFRQLCMVSVFSPTCSDVYHIGSSNTT